MRRGLARLGRDTYWPALGYRCDEGLVEAVEGEWSRTELAQRVRAIGLQVHGGFASAAEQAAMVRELEEGPLRVLRWETGHWDAVISEYRETERLQWTAPEARAVLRRMRALFPRPWSWRPAAHVLDLRGDIGPHVDAVSIVGEVVCGLSLLSPAVMRFESDTEAFRVLLEPGSVYIMAGESRYSFKHSIMTSDQVFKGKPVQKTRRISVMLRDFTASEARQ